MARAPDKPDLILLDVVMPRMDGYEVCRHLKATPATREIPVIFLTGVTDAANEEKGFEVGAVDYIHKPFSPPLILARVKNQLALQSALRQAREDRDQAEELFRALQAEVRHVARLTTMGELAASIAHEIRQPLAAVVNNANAGLRWLNNQPPNLKQVRTALKRIVSDSERGGDVIGSIQGMVKKGEEERARLDINDLIREVMRLVQGELKNRGVSSRAELADDLPRVLADRIQLRQVILNLIMNAIEAMGSVSDPHVSCGCDPKSMAMTECSLQLKILGRELLRKIWTASSKRFLRQNPREWEWGFQSAARLSNPTAVAYRRREQIRADRCSKSSCQLLNLAIIDEGPIRRALRPSMLRR